MNKAIWFFMLGLIGFFLYKALTEDVVFLACIFVLLPLFMVFNSRRSKDKKMDKLIDAVNHKK